MAKPLKPFVRGGGYYPSSRWTPLVYPGGYTTANGNGAEPTPLIKTVKGAIAHVTDAIAMPVIGLKCEINPLQAGTGDPSPTNVRPITGFAGCNIYHSGADMNNPTAYSITFPASAGIVYGGTLDVVNKKLTVTNKRVLLADLTWSKAGGNTIFRCREITDAEYGNYFGTRILCSNYNPYVGAYASLPDGAIALNNLGYSNTPYLIIKDNAKISGTIEDFVASLANQTIIYPLASPIVYGLTDISEMTMLLGANNIWHDANGDTELTYYAE